MIVAALIAIDPGVNSGAALFVDGELRDCWLNPPPSVYITLDEQDMAVIEQPRIYPGGKTKNPNSIVALALNAGEHGGQLKARGVSVEYVYPQQWKGTVPKEIHHARCWAALPNREKLVVERATKGIAPSKRNNVLDAVFLGVWSLRRNGGHNLP